MKSKRNDVSYLYKHCVAYVVRPAIKKAGGQPFGPKNEGESMLKYSWWRVELRLFIRINTNI